MTEFAEQFIAMGYLLVSSGNEGPLREILRT